MIQDKMQNNMVRNLENFLEMMTVEKLVSANTIVSYRSDINDLLLFLTSNNMALEAATYNQLSLYISHLHDMSYTSSTIARKISAIRTFFSFLLLDGVTTANPTTRLALPKKIQTLPRVLSRINIAKLIEAAKFDKTPCGVRNLAMLEILYSTGIRVSELVTIEVEGVVYALNSSEHTIIIRGKGGRERLIILNEAAITAVKEYLLVRYSIVPKLNLAKVSCLFHSLSKKGKVTHISRQKFGQILKELAIHKGVSAKIVSPHKIRHSFASHMLQNGADVRVIQELLGHVSISSTQIYTKVENQHMASELAAKHPLSNFSDILPDEEA